MPITAPATDLQLAAGLARYDRIRIASAACYFNHGGPAFPADSGVVSALVRQVRIDIAGNVRVDCVGAGRSFHFVTGTGNVVEVVQ